MTGIIPFGGRPNHLGGAPQKIATGNHPLLFKKKTAGQNASPDPTARNARAVRYIQQGNNPPQQAQPRQNAQPAGHNNPAAQHNNPPAQQESSYTFLSICGKIGLLTYKFFTLDYISSRAYTLGGWCIALPEWNAIHGSYQSVSNGFPVSRTFSKRIKYVEMVNGKENELGLGNIITTQTIHPAQFVKDIATNGMVGLAKVACTTACARQVLPSWEIFDLLDVPSKLTFRYILPGIHWLSTNTISAVTSSVLNPKGFFEGSANLVMGGLLLSGIHDMIGKDSLPENEPEGSVNVERLVAAETGFKNEIVPNSNGETKLTMKVTKFAGNLSIIYKTPDSKFWWGVGQVIAAVVGINTFNYVYR